MLAIERSNRVATARKKMRQTWLEYTRERRKFVEAVRGEQERVATALPNGGSWQHAFPDELLQYTFEKLQLPQLLVAAKVSQTWHDVALGVLRKQYAGVLAVSATVTGPCGSSKAAPRWPGLQMPQWLISAPGADGLFPSLGQRLGASCKTVFAEGDTFNGLDCVLAACNDRLICTHDSVPGCIVGHVGSHGPLVNTSLLDFRPTATGASKDRLYYGAPNGSLVSLCPAPTPVAEPVAADEFILSIEWSEAARCLVVAYGPLGFGCTRIVILSGDPLKAIHEMEPDYPFPAENRFTSVMFPARPGQCMQCLWGDRLGLIAMRGVGPDAPEELVPTNRQYHLDQIVSVGPQRVVVSADNQGGVASIVDLKDSGNTSEFEIYNRVDAAAATVRSETNFVSLAARGNMLFWSTEYEEYDATAILVYVVPENISDTVLAFRMLDYAAGRLTLTDTRLLVHDADGAVYTVPIAWDAIQ
jgi:hypothetical protein